jgi:hypothetical protein
MFRIIEFAKKNSGYYTELNNFRKLPFFFPDEYYASKFLVRLSIRRKFIAFLHFTSGLTEHFEVPFENDMDYIP